eukprot:g18479.t1
MSSFVNRVSLDRGLSRQSLDRGVSRQNSGGSQRRTGHEPTVTSSEPSHSMSAIRFNNEGGTGTSTNLPPPGVGGVVSPGAGLPPPLSLGFGNDSMQQLRPDGVKAKGTETDVSNLLKKCGMGLWKANNCELGDRVNAPSKWFATIARYVREQIATMKANKITILAHSENKEIQVLFLKKSHKVFILRESGKSVLYEPDEIEAVGVVPYNNTDFLVKTMHVNIFADKCTHAGAYLVK